MLRALTLAVGVEAASLSADAVIRAIQRGRWDRKPKEDDGTNGPRFRTVVWLWTALFSGSIATIAASALAWTVVANRGDAIAGRAAWRALYSLSSSASSTGWRGWVLSYPMAFVTGATLVAAAWTAYSQVAPYQDGWRYRSRPRSSNDGRASVRRAAYAYGLAVYAALAIVTMALARDGRWQTAASVLFPLIPLTIVARTLSP